MTTRKDICTARTSNGKTYWTKIGSAFISDKGISLEFDALPIPQLDEKTGQLRVRAMLFDPKAKSDAPKSGGFDRGNLEDSDMPF